MIYVKRVLIGITLINTVHAVSDEEWSPMKTQKDHLREYNKKRDFSQTPEPEGKQQKKSSQARFVIHKHDATSLHYDLRLEIDGVMPSWAIPKGPSLDPAIKRLAVRTEDHPLEYAKFEGVIPEGHYGAGPVMIWDFGTFENIKQHNGQLVPLEDCLEEGQLEFILHGKKLEGAFALVQTRKIGKQQQWLLIKMKDEYASARKNPVKTKNKSAVTDRTMKQILKDG